MTKRKHVVKRGPTSRARMVLRRMGCDDIAQTVRGMPFGRGIRLTVAGLFDEPVDLDLVRTVNRGRERWSCPKSCVSGMTLVRALDHALTWGRNAAG